MSLRTGWPSGPGVVVTGMAGFFSLFLLVFPLPLPHLPFPLGVVLLVRVLALVSVVFVVDVSFGVGG